MLHRSWLMWMAGLVLSIAAPPTFAITLGWSELPNSPLAGAAQRHDDLDFIDPLRGWVVNGDGEVWYTEDGGDSWSLRADTGVYNRCVAFISPTRGFIGTLYQSNGEPLLETKDGGLNWVEAPLPDPAPRGICGLEALNDSTVCGVGTYYGYPTFIRTVNGGDSWTKKDMSAYCGALVDTHWFSPDSGLAVGSTPPGSSRKARVLLTTDGGATWSVRYTGTRNREICWKISFVSRLVGFVSIENLNNGVGAAYFLKTTDGGLTWSEQLLSSTYLNCQGIGFVDAQTGWIGGWNFTTEATHDGGATWATTGPGFHMNRFRFLTPSLGYACGQKVYKYVGSVTGTPDEAPVAPARLLGQNSPNPFRSRTTIAYRVTQPGAVSLLVFDLQGRRVATLVQATQPPGNYTTTLDGADLAAGAYFYQLITPTGVETRRMWVAR